MKRLAKPRQWARYLTGLALGLICVGVMKVADAAAMSQGPQMPSMQHVLQAEVAAMGRARTRGWPADSGAVVVLDPRSGAVAATPGIAPRHSA